MGKNIERTIIAALLVASGMLDDMKIMISKHSNYNLMFARRNIRKIKNLKYVRNPLYHRNFSFYQRKTY